MTKFACVSWIHLLPHQSGGALPSPHPSAACACGFASESEALQATGGRFQHGEHPPTSVPPPRGRWTPHLSDAKATLPNLLGPKAAPSHPPPADRNPEVRTVNGGVASQSRAAVRPVGEHCVISGGAVGFGPQGGWVWASKPLGPGNQRWQLSVAPARDSASPGLCRRTCPALRSPQAPPWSAKSSDFARRSDPAERDRCVSDCSSSRPCGGWCRNARRKS